MLNFKSILLAEFLFSYFKLKLSKIIWQLIYRTRKPPAVYRQHLTCLHSCFSYICCTSSPKRLFCSCLRTFSPEWDMTCSEKKEKGNKLTTQTIFPSQFAQKLFNTLTNVLNLNLDCRPFVSVSRFIYCLLIHHEATTINLNKILWFRHKNYRLNRMLFDSTHHSVLHLQHHGSFGVPFKHGNTQTKRLGNLILNDRLQLFVITNQNYLPRS